MPRQQAYKKPANMTDKKRFSFEFFPPKTNAGRQKLEAVQAQLNTLGPDFFSVTYGAGGSTRDNTKDIILAMNAQSIATAPHLSFGADSEESILALLQEYQAAGVNRLVALRGDMPSGMGAQRLVYASELVDFVRRHTGDYFDITVAAYPEIHPDADSFDADLGFLKQKFDAGANSAITQYFYNADGYFYFVEQCRRAGIEQPIYPGIMPITNSHNLARFSNKRGADIPRWDSQNLQGYGEDEASIRSFGTEGVTDLCQRLLAGGAPGFHFYSMNQVEPNKTIWNNLDLSSHLTP
jgi:methylenetetrahydrofolate reductase (NADPH)